MVIVYHLIWTIYGYWFPNDLRGSMSKFVASDVLKELTELHYGRKQIQPTHAHLREFDEKARPLLKFPVIEFTDDAIVTVSDAFAQVILDCRYTCYACAILRDHVHVVFRKHKHLAEEMITNLQRESHLLLRERALFDLEHPVWGGHGWKVYLDHPTEVWRTIPYVETNPIQARLGAQKFDFVTTYDDWPLFEGHDPNSPFARAMREHELRNRKR
jgi:REP element-mobilizing transposase RayT